ncbi:MAG: hypothetical protein LIO77_00480 [Rikenellaceae bacterium]|nr:hypothetical protein [Rikenellaceae bacterium]
MDIIGANPADDTQVLISNFIDTWPETIIAQVDDIYNPTSMTIAAEQYFDGEPPYWLYLAGQSSMTFTINSSNWSMYGTHPNPGGYLAGAAGTSAYYPLIYDDITLTKD